MRKMIMFPWIVICAIIIGCSSSDDKSATEEAANSTAEDSNNAVNFSLSTSDAGKIVKFCIFGTYCDENGRQAEAIQYEVSAWVFSGDDEDPQGELLYEKELSPLLITDYEDGTSDQSAEPLCINLPDTEEEDAYYLEIYYGGLIRSGVVTEAQVKELYDGEDRINYYHFREGNCNLNDSPVLFSI